MFGPFTDHLISNKILKMKSKTMFPFEAIVGLR